MRPGHPAEVDGTACLKSIPESEFAPVSSPPVVRVTHEVPRAGWKCFGNAGSEATWITVASLVETSDTREELVGRFGAVSLLATARYWSVTDGKWRPLVSSAVALSASQADASRTDYSAEELEGSDAMHYRVTDSRSGRAITYGLRLRSMGPRQFAVETTNLEAVKEWGVTFFAPGGLRTLYYLG